MADTTDPWPSEITADIARRFDQYGLYVDVTVPSVLLPKAVTALADAGLVLRRAAGSGPQTIGGPLDEDDDPNPRYRVDLLPSQ